MASELVNSATSDKLTEVDWAKNIEVCELVACDQRYYFLHDLNMGGILINNR
uniref:Uncharacterized protein n=1 Tax=Rhizophora mucronata TaxID=61149 RepID=A0A2P2KFE4_RHIMU